MRTLKIYPARQHSKNDEEIFHLNQIYLYGELEKIIGYDNCSCSKDLKYIIDWLTDENTDFNSASLACDTAYNRDEEEILIPSRLYLWSSSIGIKGLVCKSDDEDAMIFAENESKGKSPIINA